MNGSRTLRRLIWLPLAALLAIPAVPAQATAPGDNGRIAYSAEAGAGVQLFTVRQDGSGVRQLTTVAGEAVNADWSPDGKRLVFELGDENHAGIVVMNRDGSGLRDLTPTGFQGNPAFTADGHRIVFDSEDGIAVMRTDGTGRRQLTIRPDGSGLRLLTRFSGGAVNAFTGSYSPDGRWITYRLEDHGTFALTKLRADGGGHPQQILSLPTAPRYIDWGSR